MKMKLPRFLNILPGAAVGGLLFAACSDEAEETWTPAEPSPTDSLVQIVFDLPSCYSYAGSLSTRATDDGDNVQTNSSTTTDEPEPRYFPTNKKVDPQWTSQLLEEGQTVWLSYKLVKNADNTSVTNPDEKTKPYVVRGNAAGRSLYACDMKDTIMTRNGVTNKWTIPDSTVSDVPLYLPVGTYNFRVMAPALPILKEEGQHNYCALVENGVYFCSSDERYKNTMGRDKQVSPEGNGSGLMRITLNPMVWQVARLKFTIVSDPTGPAFELGVMPSGIEVSGLQHPYNDAGTQDYYNWRSGTSEDTIRMKRGDKSEWVRISGDECTVSNNTVTGDVAVLPTNAMSTTIVILFNLTINGVPTQYETSVNQKILEHGHSYSMTLKVSMKEGITAMTWYNQSWTDDVTFGPERRQQP